MFAVVSLLGYDFLAASAKAKIVDVATNLGRCCSSCRTGRSPGAWASSSARPTRSAATWARGRPPAGGSGFIRVAVLTVVTVLVARVGWDVGTGNLRPVLG